VPSIWVHRDHQICTCHRISAYRELEHQVGEAESGDIAIRDIPIKS
jgi:hypothetical protein